MGRLIAALCACVGLLAGVSAVALAGGAKTSRVDVSSSGTHSNDQSVAPSISANGRFVAFASGGSNLVPGDTNRRPDIFVHDRRTGKTRRVSLNSVGVQGNGYSSHPSISANGRFVALSPTPGTWPTGTWFGATSSKSTCATAEPERRSSPA